MIDNTMALMHALKLPGGDNGLHVDNAQYDTS